MNALGPHAVYIVGAYAGVGLVTMSLIIWVYLNSKKQKARLADLHARGYTRRSENQKG